MTETHQSEHSGAIGVGGLRTTTHRARVRRGRGCLPLMAILVVIAVVGVFGYVKGVSFIKDKLSGPEDYSGDGHKPVVTIEVKPGDTATDIGETLHDKGVVKSAEAFSDA